jgi:hypothetical protein
VITVRSGHTAPERVNGESYRTTLVCVDGGGAGEISGRICNPYLDGGTPFSGTLEFLSGMEDLMDQMQLPQAYTASRRFSSSNEPSPAKPPEDGQEQGARATFAVRVLFRQNTSWQGSVTWLEGKQDAHFRSVLELLLLMKSALDQLRQATLIPSTLYHKDKGEQYA